MSDTPSVLAGLAPWPVVDFAAYGEVDLQPLSKIQKLTGAFLGRNWVAIPHVTHHDEVDVTALDAYRRRLEGEGRKLSPLPFIVKAVVSALQAFPVFNASLDIASNKLVVKRYYHVGIATDTPSGLMVPVVRDCDKKDIAAIAADIADLSGRARTKGIPLADMSGGSFTISSLGALGGTGFTPIINAPEVAILGVSRTRQVQQPGEGGAVVWRAMLPVSLSYDHRVINGVGAGKFLAHIAAKLNNPEAL